MLVRVRNVGARAFMRESGLSMHLLLVSHGNGRAGRGHDDERYLCLAGFSKIQFRLIIKSLLKCCKRAKFLSIYVNSPSRNVAFANLVKECGNSKFLSLSTSERFRVRAFIIVFRP